MGTNFENDSKSYINDNLKFCIHSALNLIRKYLIVNEEAQGNVQDILVSYATNN